MTYEQAHELLKKYNQLHLLVSYNGLTDEEKEELLQSISEIDFEQAISLAKVSKEQINLGEITPVTSVTDTDFSADEKREIQALGRNIISNGEYAVITMAGGQGTRLGHSGPKGTFKLALNTGDKYIFQIFIENLQAAYEKYGVYINWYVMTSVANHEETVAFFESNNYFGYPKEKVTFFRQGELPITDTDGNLVLESKEKVFKAADGNGGIFNALSKNGITNKLKADGVKWVLVTGVDNILVNMADEMYIGLTARSNTFNGVKSIEKTIPNEKVGVFCKRGGKPSIVEYSEMDDDMRNAKAEDGSLLYKDANIVNHLLSIELLEKIQDERLPIHRAHKSLNYIDRDGNFVIATDPNLFKYECFIFDYFNMVDDVMIYRVDRNKEFAPVKNKEGADSPYTATELYNALH